MSSVNSPRCYTAVIERFSFNNRNIRRTVRAWIASAIIRRPLVSWTFPGPGDDRATTSAVLPTRYEKSPFDGCGKAFAIEDTGSILKSLTSPLPVTSPLFERRLFYLQARTSGSAIPDPANSMCLRCSGCRFGTRRGRQMSIRRAIANTHSYRRQHNR